MQPPLRVSGGEGLLARKTRSQLVEKQSKYVAHRFGLGHALIAVVRLDQADQAGASPVRGVDREPHQAAGQVADVSVPELREHCDQLSGQFLPDQRDGGQGWSPF